MLRSKRYSQLLVVLSLSAVISAYVSLVIHRILEATALPRFMTDLSRDLASIQDTTVVKNVCLTVVEGSLEVHRNGSVLATWGIGFVLLWSIPIGLVAVLLLRELNRDDRRDAEPVRANIVDLALAGKIELWKAFWVLFAGSMVLVYLAAFGLSKLFSSPDGTGASMLAALWGFPLAISVFYAVYLVSAFAVWRCAANASRMIWRHLARGTVLVLTVGPIVKSLIAAGWVFSR